MRSFTIAFATYLFMLVSFPAHAQENADTASKVGLQFKNGTLSDFMNRNLHYPEDAREHCIQGIVEIRFVIDTTGIVDSISVLHSADELLDSAAVQLIRLTSEKWYWAGGPKAKIHFKLPITFHLDDAMCKNGTYYYNEGVKAYENKKTKDAIALFERALKYDYRDAGALYNLAVIYIKDDQPDKGCLYLKEMKELGSKKVDGLISEYCTGK